MEKTTSMKEHASIVSMRHCHIEEPFVPISLYPLPPLYKIPLHSHCFTCHSISIQMVKFLFIFSVLLISLAAATTIVSGTDEERRREYRQCVQQCQQGPHVQQRRCLQRCERAYRERGHEEEEREMGREVNPREEEERGHPYAFHEQSWTERVRTEHGRMRVLPRFTERSELLQRIENYRIGLLEAAPRAFVVPNHFDADAILFIIAGKGTISLLHKDRKEAIDVQTGHLVQVSAGSMFYIVNKDNNDELRIATLLRPVNTPARYRVYFGTGGENPESFYRSFSREVLESAFNAPWERLQRLFGQRREGAIIRASEEEIRRITCSASEGKWGINLFDRRPDYSSRRGQFHQINPNEWEEHRNLDIVISYANISSGSMVAPFYNSRATMLAMVVDGSGYFEMACPHLAGARWREEGKEEQREKEGPGTYECIRSRLQKNTLYIVPAGHPVATVASGDQNLQVLCFELNARGNERNYLAGRNTVYQRLEREEAELSFGVPAREVEEVFHAQKETILLPGPQQREQGGEEGHSGEILLESFFELSVL